jgi:hypothetical protein
MKTADREAPRNVPSAQDLLVEIMENNRSKDPALSDHCRTRRRGPAHSRTGAWPLILLNVIPDSGIKPLSGIRNRMRAVKW